MEGALVELCPEMDVSGAQEFWTQPEPGPEMAWLAAEVARLQRENFELRQQAVIGKAFMPRP